MDAKTRRLMKSKQGRTETGSGNIAVSEGSSGDIQVRMTSKGPRLFAKLGNKWFISELKDQESSQNEVRMHTFKGTMIAGTSANIPIPSWISSSSVVGVMFFANHSSNLWHIYEWRSDTGDQAQVKHRVFYDRGQHRIEVDGMGTQIDDGKQYRVIVFYT